jgi:hypothetical protein
LPVPTNRWGKWPASGPGPVCLKRHEISSAWGNRQDRCKTPQRAWETGPSRSVTHVVGEACSGRAGRSRPGTDACSGRAGRSRPGTHTCSARVRRSRDGTDTTAVALVAQEVPPKVGGPLLPGHGVCRVVGGTLPLSGATRRVRPRACATSTEADELTGSAAVSRGPRCRSARRRSVESRLMPHRRPRPRRPTT